MAEAHIYHFTDTAHLPWIVEAGELQPGRNQIGGFPVDFLWATSSHQGDRTAAGIQGYRSGQTALVRLTLHAEDFELWPAILTRFPQWTDEHVRILEAAARSYGVTTFEHWRARAEPLPLSRVLGTEAKTYTGRWQAIAQQAACLRSRKAPTMRGVLLNGVVYASIQQIEPGKPTAYATAKVPLAEWWI